LACLYIEAGANRGRSAKRFYKQHKDINFEYHLFEANPNIIADLNSSVVCIQGERTIYNKAVWTENDIEMEIKIDKTTKGSTICEKSVRVNETAVTSTIDFDEWFRACCKEDDYIVLVIDIEGAEYEVLPKMIDNGCFDMVDELTIEFHGHKMKNKKFTSDMNKLFRDYFNTMKFNKCELYFIDKI